MENEVSDSEFSKAYKKRQAARAKMVAEMAKANPDNKVIAELQEDLDAEKKREDNKADMAEWDMVDAAYWAARDIYMDGEVSIEKAMSELVGAIQACMAACKMKKYK